MFKFVFLLLIVAPGVHAGETEVYAGSAYSLKYKIEYPKSGTGEGHIQIGNKNISGFIKGMHLAKAPDETTYICLNKTTYFFFEDIVIPVKFEIAGDPIFF